MGGCETGVTWDDWRDVDEQVWNVSSCILGAIYFIERRGARGRLRVGFLFVLAGQCIE